MRRTLAAALLALAAAAPAHAAFDPWTVVRDVVGECMDCVPQVYCVNYPYCPVDVWVPPLP